MGQGFTLFTTSLFGLIPGPIIFGRIIDSTCSIWNNKCGHRGNCILYDPIKFRYYVHLSSAFFMAIGVLFDFLIWCNVRNLDLYADVNDETNEIDDSKKTNCSPENEPLNK